jgi:hypothetical protein
LLKIIKSKLKLWKSIISQLCWKQIVFARYRKKEQLVAQKIKLGKKITVVFLVREVSKWNATTVYRRMLENPLFDVFIALTIIKDQYTTETERIEELEKSKSFFKNLDMKSVVLYDPKSDSESCLSGYHPDLIFYDQPWSLKNDYALKKTSNFALSAYIPYSLEIANTAEANFNTEFQNLLWMYFAPNKFVDTLFRKGYLGRSMRSFISGYPKLDAYLDKTTKNSKKKIIFAPHHSLENNSGLQYATFLWSGALILELAKKHSDYEWVFKPHPRLRSALVTNSVMTRVEADEYYSSWSTLPNTSVYDGGEYLELFKSSDAMITDCVSFLAEYLPSENPILHLINAKSIGYNSLGSQIIKDYYKATNVNEFLAHFDKVVINEEDVLKEKRLEALEHVYLAPEGAGNSIVNHLLLALKGT